MGYDLDESKKIFRWLTQHRLIKITPIGYVKQPMFTKFLKRIDGDENTGIHEFNY
jgi:hypothetical protein